MEQRFLPVKLTDAELQAKMESLAKSEIALNIVEDEKKQEMSTFKHRIDTIKNDISSAARVIDSGKEYRTVDCEWHMDTPDNGIKSCIRIDTEETVLMFAMNQEDIQEDLPFDEDTKPEDDELEEDTREEDHRHYAKAEDAEDGEFEEIPVEDDDEDDE